VKRETLYAYVSRGLIHREMDLDGRSSRFDPVEIDRLRNRARRTASGELSTVISSSITRLRPSGHEYRGVAAVELVRAGTAFETVADLLWNDAGEWPLPSSIATDPGDIGPLDRLRIAVARASAADVLRYDLAPQAVASVGRRLIGAMIDALPRVTVDDEEPTSIAQRLWRRISTLDPTADRVAVLQAALVMLADHGLAASTFAVRIAASVRADPYSCVSTGLGALGGQFHGAASVAVHRLIARAAELESAEDALGEWLAAGLPVPGCGHKVYSNVDPRHQLLDELTGVAWLGDPRLALAVAVREAATRRADRLANVDMALGTFSWLAGTGPDVGESVFAIARTAGWLAHAIEEFREPPLRFRAEARHVSN
jgi:citrate synthase